MNLIKKLYLLDKKLVIKGDEKSMFQLLVENNLKVGDIIVDANTHEFLKYLSHNKKTMVVENVDTKIKAIYPLSKGEYFAIKSIEEINQQNISTELFETNLEKILA